MDLRDLVAIAQADADAWDAPVAAFRIAGTDFDTDTRPIVMGVVNLSLDSTYRESIAPTRADALRRGRIMHAQGATVVDIGAESSRATARRSSSDDQIASLVPVIEDFAAAGIPTSVESYDLDVIRVGLRAGATVVNLTGTQDEEAIYHLAAEHQASVVMCFVPGQTVRDEIALQINQDPFPALVDHFAPRVDKARASGVPSIAVDPGLGFFYKSVIDPRIKIRYQLRTLLGCYRLRCLGVPVCALTPQGIEVFQEEASIGESVTGIFASLGGVGILRVHEVSRVTAVLRLLELES